MTIGEYYDYLAEIALGWLGWSEDQALDADVNAIIIGHRGKIDMLKACFGSSEQEAEPAKLPSFTAGDFRSK